MTLVWLLIKIFSRNNNDLKNFFFNKIFHGIYLFFLFIALIEFMFLSRGLSFQGILSDHQTFSALFPPKHNRGSYLLRVL